MAEPIQATEPPRARSSARTTLAMLRGISREGRYVAAITVFAALLRLSFLDSKSLWMDEGMTVCRVGHSLRQLWSIVLHAEMNMCAYYLMMHAWTAFAGTGEFALRLPSVIFDTATVPLVYLLGKEFGDRRAGLIAALMLGLNASSIEYAQTARSYAMLVALSTPAWIFFVRGMRHPSAGNFAGYIICGASAMYAHLFAVFAIPAQALILLWMRPPAVTIRRMILSLVAVGVLGLPALYFGITGYHGNIAWVPSLSVASVLRLFAFFSGAFEGQGVALAVMLTALYAAGIVLAILAAPRERRTAPAFLLIAILSPLVIVVAISMFRSIFMLRYLLAGLPLYILLAAMGFSQLKARCAIAMISAAALLSVGGVWTYYRAPGIQDWRGVTAFIADDSRPSDLWIMYPDSSGCLFNYYHSRYDKTFPWDFLQKESDKNIDPVVRRLSGITKDGHGRRVWLTYPLADPLDISSLRPAFAVGKIVESGFPGVRVVLFEPR